MKTMVLPFGYPGYPQKELKEKIDNSITYLTDIGIDAVAAPSVITLEDCKATVEVANSSDYDYCIVLLASWIESPNVLNIISAAQLERMPILLWSHDNVYDVKNDEYIHPYIFQEDLYTPDGGDDFILFEILKNYFIQEKYDQAFISLQHLTKTNIDEKVLNRAIFYMGQSLYFCANYEEAITTFVKVAEIYPELTKKWIVLSLDALNLPN